MLVFRRIEESDIRPDLMDDFIWRMEVTREWKNGRAVKLRKSRVDDKTLDELRAVVKWDLLPMVYGRRALGHRGAVFGAFEGERLVGFAFLRDKLIQGRESVGVLWVSADYRRHGVGRKLFMLCADAARDAEAATLYISTHPNAETQAFYISLGCYETERLPNAGPKTDIPREYKL